MTYNELLKNEEIKETRDGYIVAESGRKIERVFVGKKLSQKWLSDGIIYRNIFDAYWQNTMCDEKDVKEVDYYCTWDYEKEYRYGIEIA